VPEGDSIWKVAVDLRPLLEGKAIARVDSRYRERVRGLEGAVVESIETVGKHLLIHFDDGTTLRTHLGMKGTWRRYDPGARWGRPMDSMGVVLATEVDECVLFFAKHVDRFRTRDRPIHPILSALGPDLLGESFDLDQVVRRVRSAPGPLADVLLDQNVACGIGNVYKSEVLFIEGHHPRAGSEGLVDDTLRALYRRARRVMKGNLRLDRRNTTGRRDSNTWVYQRGGRPCLKCDTKIEVANEGEPPRYTWWCPRCQPAAA